MIFKSNLHDFYKTSKERRGSQTLHTLLGSLIVLFKLLKSVYCYNSRIPHRYLFITTVTLYLYLRTLILVAVPLLALNELMLSVFIVLIISHCYLLKSSFSGLYHHHVSGSTI